MAQSSQRQRMDWKLASATFLTIFVAEMGDKTQLGAFAMAGGGSSKWAVFVRGSVALVATTAIAVLAGGIVGRYVPEFWLKRGAGVAFIAMGIVMLLARPEAPSADGGRETAPQVSNTLESLLGENIGGIALLGIKLSIAILVIEELGGIREIVVEDGEQVVILSVFDTYRVVAANVRPIDVDSIEEILNVEGHKERTG